LKPGAVENIISVRTVFSAAGINLNSSMSKDFLVEKTIRDNLIMAMGTVLDKQKASHLVNDLYISLTCSTGYPAA